MNFLVMLLFALIPGYFAYQFYEFEFSDTGELSQKKTAVAQLETSVAALRKKKQERIEFAHSADERTALIRNLSVKLNEQKQTLTDSVNIPEFMKAIAVEAKKVGVTITKITPSPRKQNDFYVEQPFDVSFQAVYVQVVALFDRMSSLEKIASIDRFDLRPRNEALGAKYVELEGSMQITAYSYLDTREDDMARDPTKIKTEEIKKEVPPS